MHAMCLEHLAQHLVSGARVLDVGSGSGYLTACMALMVGPQGRVVGVEKVRGRRRHAWPPSTRDGRPVANKCTGAARQLCSCVQQPGKHGYLQMVKHN